MEQVKEELTRFECVDETSKRGRSRMSRKGTGNIFSSEVMREFKVKKTRNENLYHQSRVTRHDDISTSPRREYSTTLP